MSRAIGRRWIGRASRMAGAALRHGAGLWLALQIVYTPIHLYQVPHSDETELCAATPLASAAAFVGDEHQDGDGHHKRHPAGQHKFKLVNSERLVLGPIFVVPAVPWVDAERSFPQSQVFGFSGLSPPELPVSWQFFFRAALPVRAPSLLS